MLSLKDCIGFCGLTHEEVAAIAEHERVPEIIAAGIANHLVEEQEGYRKIGAMIADDINWAAMRGKAGQVAALRGTLEGFVAVHPEAMASERVRRCLGC